MLYLSSVNKNSRRTWWVLAWCTIINCLSITSCSIGQNLGKLLLKTSYCFETPTVVLLFLTGHYVLGCWQLPHAEEEKVISERHHKKQRKQSEIWKANGNEWFRWRRGAFRKLSWGRSYHSSRGQCLSQRYSKKIISGKTLGSLADLLFCSSE